VGSRNRWPGLLFTPHILIAEPEVGLCHNEGITMRPLHVTPARALLAATVAATLATAYIHYTLGGLLFLLNAMGYLALAVALVVPLTFVQRLRPLVLLGLGAYTSATIIGWLIMGPYFQLAYITKAIEVVLLGLIAAQLVLGRADFVPSLRFARALGWRAARRALRRPVTVAGPDASAADTPRT
jgi:hypothetical protein